MSCDQKPYPTFAAVEEKYGWYAKEFQASG
jgi:hypothetical protein